MDLFPLRHCANRLKDLDEVEFRARLRDSGVCKQFGIHDNETGTKLHKREYSYLC